MRWVNQRSLDVWGAFLNFEPGYLLSVYRMEDLCKHGYFSEHKMVKYSKVNE